MQPHWVTSWVAMPQLTEPENMPPEPFTRDNLVLADSTLRQTVRTSIGGTRLRLRISNAFGGVALPITAVSVALPAGGRAGVSAIEPGTARAVTFHGRAAVVVPVGALVVSDPLTVPVAPLSHLSVTMYLAQGQASMDITSHPGSRTTSYLLAGNHLTDEDLPGAVPVEHWYFLSAVEVLAEPGAGAEAGPEAGAEGGPEAGPEAEPGAEPGAGPEAKPEARPEAEPGVGPEARPEAGPEAEPGVGPEARPEAEPEARPEAEPEARPEAGRKARLEAGSTAAAAVFVGDSLTDGRGSTTNGDDRWPDQLLARLQAHPSTAHVAVLNQGGGGNRVLNDGLGPSLLSRVDRDVLAQTGVRWLFVFTGVNDIGTAAATEADQKQVAEDLIAAFDQIVTRAHAHGIKVYGATILPFGGNDAYDDPDGFRDRARQIVNTWIRTGRRFDAVVDFDRAARDPGHPRQLRPEYHDGDFLHLNPTGYGALAAAVPAELFIIDVHE